MKKLYFGAALLFVALTSCSTSDGNNTNTSSSVFLPLTSTSSWIYDVKVNAQNTGKDTLFIDGETTINNKIYQKFKTKSVATGFYTNLLNNNNVRKEGDQLLLSGTTGLGFSAILPINLTLSDFVIFKELANPNEELASVSGTIEQEIQNIPLKINYILKSVFKESLNSFSVPGKETYTNVKVVKIVANISVSTVYLLPVINTPITVPVLNAQDVIVSTHYYAEGVGMIYSKTAINYQLNQLPQGTGELPIPQEGSSTIEEFLN